MIKIKIHNVRHKEHNQNTDKIEENMAEYIEEGQSVNIENVRIASGSENSPIFITLDQSDINLQKMKSISRVALNYFSRYVDGVNVNKEIKDRNLRVVRD